MSSGVLSQSPSLEDNDRKNFRRSLLNIDSNLEDTEVEKLKFLCRDFVSHKKLEKAHSASDIFEDLMTEDLLSEKDPFLLAELLYIMKQNLLLKHLHYTKEQVKGLLPTRKKVSPFRSLLYELSEDIDSDSLKRMIFLQKESLPKVETLTSLSFLGHLEKQAKIDADDLKLLEDLCKNVLPHLVKKMEKYKREREAEKKEKELISASDINQMLRALPAGPSDAPLFREAGEFAETLQSTAILSQCQEHDEDGTVYRMDRKHRGYCVVINNQNFISLSKREGTDKDAECLKHVFQWLGFNVDIWVDVTEKCLEEVLQKYQSHPDHAKGDCFVFCVLTHGKFGAVYSSDDALIPIQEIMSHFTAQRCPGLANKPKLFFIQACQGKEIQSSVSIEADAINPESTEPPLKESIPVEADFLLGLATVPGYVSFRHRIEGSWYIQSLCDHLKDMVPRREDILSILTVVNNDVSRRGGTKKQIPQPVFTLRKKVIFPVPLQGLPERVSMDS